MTISNTPSNKVKYYFVTMKCKHGVLRGPSYPLKSQVSPRKNIFRSLP